MGGKRTNFRAGDGNVHGFREVDLLIGELARRQSGRVARRQLLAAGIGREAIDHRIRCGRLIPEHDGVYAVGFRIPDSLARWTSALLAVGDDGVLSHLAAAAAQKFGPDPVIVDITCPRQLRSRRGIRLHHHSLDPRDVTRLGSLPLTSPSQTLFDLSTMLSAKRLAAAANETFVLQLVTIDDLYETLARNSGRKGAAAFRRLLATLDPEGHRVRSPLEIRLNAFLRARGFPPWESNVRLRVGDDVIEPDVLWRAQRVIVEADGRDPHLAPLTFASDRRRDRRLNAERWHPVRVTEQDLGPGAEELDRDLRTILGLQQAE
jgi:very-short-patch-repair endonuclease